MVHQTGLLDEIVVNWPGLILDDDLFFCGHKISVWVWDEPGGPAVHLCTTSLSCISSAVLPCFGWSGFKKNSFRKFLKIRTIQNTDERLGWCCAPYCTTGPPLWFGTSLTDIRSSLVLDSCWQYLVLHSYLIFSHVFLALFSRVRLLSNFLVFNCSRSMWLWFIVLGLVLLLLWLFLRQEACRWLRGPQNRFL